MGYYLETYCTKCQKKQTFRLGQGLRDNDPEKVISKFDSPEAEEVRKIIFSKDIEKIWNFNTVLGVCADCRALLEVPFFTARFINNHSVADITRKCQCGKTPDIITEPENQAIICPQCNHILEKKIIGYWD
jgi:hypothetical protein